MARSKEYVINLVPISWKRPGLSKKTFYDQQKHERLACGLHLNQQHGADPKFNCPIHVDAVFYMPIPKNVSRRKKTVWYFSCPDIDNLQKFLFDTINDTGSIWKDDCIVSSVTAKKLYDKNPRTHLIITELE